MALTMNDTRSVAIFSVLFIGVIAIQKKNHHIYAFGLLESLIIVDQLFYFYFFYIICQRIFTQCDCSNVPHFYIILLILFLKKNNHIALILLLQYQCRDLILFNVDLI